MAIASVLKQPAEVLKQALPLGAVTAVVSATAVARGLLVGAAALGVTASVVTSGSVMLSLTGGSDGEQYLVTVRGSDASGQTLEAELEVTVLDAAWSMPDGGAAYLSIAEFVQRFGLPEVIGMTDGVGNGRIDRAMLIGALTDAQATADAHIAGRYTVPLASVPLIVKKIVAELARAALYPRGAPDGVADQAKLALRMLERIQSGAMPIPSQAPLEQAVAENPILIAPGRRAYPDGLAGY